MTDKTVSPAQELRAAASKIRDTAVKTSHSGPWQYEPDEWAVVTESGFIADSVEDGDGQHIALWNPVVAELVAVVFDNVARTADFTQGPSGSQPPMTRSALNLARAINGEVAA